MWLLLKHHRRRLFYRLQWRCKDSLWPECNSTRPFASFHRWMKLHLGSTSSESSLFSAGFVYHSLQKWKTICGVLFSRSSTPPEDNGLFNEVFLRVRQVAAWRVATRTSLRVTTQGGVGRFDGGPPSLLRANTERRGGYEDQVDRVKRRWRLCDDV